MRRLVKAFTSPKLAVVFFILLAALLIYASFFALDSATGAIRKDFYRSWWFNSLLGLLALNILAGTLSRAPFRLHHIGFLLTHAGILVILFGAMLSNLFKIYGTMSVRENSSSDFIELEDERELRFLVQKDQNKLLFTHIVNENFNPYLPSEPKQTFLIRGTEYFVTLERFLPNVHEERYIAKFYPDELNSISLLFKVQGHPQDELHLALGQSGMVGPLRVSFQRSTAREVQTFLEPKDFSGSALYLFATEKGLQYISQSKHGDKKHGQVTQLDTSYDCLFERMKLEFEVTDIEGKCEIHSEVTPSKVEENRPRLPALLVSIMSPRETKREWVTFESEKCITLQDGVLKMKYGPKLFPLDFSIFLERFQIEKNQGTDDPSLFESNVVVYDQKDRIQRTVGVNYPLTYKGYVFYQSSYSQTPQGYISIFSVSWDPGIYVVYGGFIVLVVGLLAMFYLKPLLIKKFVP